MILKFFEEQTLKYRSDCEVEKKLLVNKLTLEHKRTVLDNA